MAEVKRGGVMSNQRREGVLLMLLSAVVFSTAGLFTKGVAAPAWDVVFWRGLTAAGFTLAYLFARGQLRGEVRSIGRAGWAIAVIGAIGTSAFIPAFKFSTVANVALIYAAAPFVAAGIAFVWLRERPSRATVFGACFALLGVAVIVSGSLGESNLLGDGLAMVMTLAMSLVMVIYRKYPGTPAALPAALSSIFLLPLGVLFGAPLAVSGGEIWVLAGFGFVFAVASVTLAEGARRLAPGEAALISSMEVPLAPLLAIVVLSEWPAPLTWVGGAMVFAAVIWSIRADAGAD